jgi:hypothetical protein
MSSWTWSLWIVLTILAPSQAQDSPYPDANDPAGQKAAGAAGSAGNSFVSNKTRNLIIILSVVVGVVVIMAGMCAPLSLMRGQNNPEGMLTSCTFISRLGHLVRDRQTATVGSARSHPSFSPSRHRCHQITTHASIPQIVRTRCFATQAFVARND